MAIVTNHANRKLRGKLVDRGKPCLYLGPAENHAGDVHRFLNLATKRIVHSRDVIWLNKVYGEWKSLPVRILPADPTDHHESEPNIKQEEDNENEDGSGNIDPNDTQEPDLDTDQNVDSDAINPKVACAMQCLGGFFNPEAQQIADRARNAATPQIPNAETSEETSDSQAGREVVNAIFERCMLDRLDVPKGFCFYGNRFSSEN